MKNFVIFMFLVVMFNGCSVTNHYKVNQDLQFEYLPEDQRVTYKFFGREQFVEVVEENKNLKLEDSLIDEYSNRSMNGSDPLEPYNRVMTSFNDYLYMNVLDPTARAYAKAVPEEFRISLSNFFHNLAFPVRFINNLLQFKFDNATEELGRFTVNSTAGVLGFMDPAQKYLDLNKKEEDFGQTLGYYGFKEGFHIVLPFYGPSNLRDTVGLVADSYINPLSDTGNLDYKIPDRPEKTLGIVVVKTVNKTSLNLGKYENLKKDAIDLYPFLKDIYTQNREKEIRE